MKGLDQTLNCRVLNDYFTKVSIEKTDKKEADEKATSAWNADEVGSSL